jgi:hypothetical protein
MRHTVEEIRNAFSYDPETGIFHWKIRKGHKKPGAIAGSEKEGRIVIRLDRRGYSAGVIAWVITYGEWPTLLIDHRDRNAMNNVLTNLRLATYRQNVHNRPKLPYNKCGYKGVFFQKTRGKYYASIRINGKQKHLGSFETPQAAHEAYCRAAEQLHGEFSCNEQAHD